MSRNTRRVACVTGAGSGIGRAIARQLATDGYQVCATDIDTDAAAETAALITADRGAATHQHLNVTVAEDWAQLLTGLAAQHGGVHCLVNNAGICISSSLQETGQELWQRMMEVNLLGTFLGIQAAVPHIAASGGGSIVNIASLAGIRGVPGLSAYSASKGGVIALTKSVAMECAQAGNGVRINVVLPGAIETPIWVKMENLGELPEDSSELARDLERHREIAAHTTPLGRVGTPEDVAGVVSFLASKCANFITGAEYTVDGGVSAGP